MALGTLLTGMALCGVLAGAILGHRTDRFSEHLAAAGGGLLFGIALFWLVPEIGESLGRSGALLLATCLAGLLAILDQSLERTGYSLRTGVVWPVLVATGIHSFVDGWSVRMLGVQPMTNFAVTTGLALHKVPEGAALGWVTKRSLKSLPQALLLSVAAESFTLVGAFAEPSLNASGESHFGAFWESGVWAVIAGAFLFVGVHSVIPAWRRLSVVTLFLATTLLVGGITAFGRG